MTASEPAMQFLADILGAPVDRPRNTETTAQGAAWLAGYRAGLCPAPGDYAGAWQLDRRFEPKMDRETRDRRYSAWKRAVQAVIAV
jgi:glycerol kinase